MAGVGFADSVQEACDLNEALLCVCVNMGGFTSNGNEVKVGGQKVLGRGRRDDGYVGEPGGVADPNVQVALEGCRWGFVTSSVGFDQQSYGHVTRNTEIGYDGLIFFTRPLACGADGRFGGTHDTQLALVQKWLEDVVHVGDVIRAVQGAS